MSQTTKEGSKLSSFIKGSAILVLSNMCLKAINFFLLPLYTNNLTPSMIGISDSITTLTGIILPLLTMGLDSAYSAFYFDNNDNDRAHKVFTTLTLSFIVLGIVPLLLMFFSSGISRTLFKTTEYSYIVRFAMISVTFNLWYLPYSLELRLQNRMFLFGLSNVIASLSMVVLNVIFVSVLSLGESALILSTMLVHIENTIILLLFVKTKPRKQWFDFELLKQMIRFALPLIPMTLMVWILSLSDRYVLLYSCGDASVGLYGISLRFTSLLNVVISAVSMAYTTFAFSSKDDKDSKIQYYYIYNIESILLLVIAFSIGLFGKEIIHLMTSESYSESYVALRDLMFSQAFYAMTSIVGYGIYFEKKSIYSLIAVSVGAVLNLGLNIILIPKYGIAAAAFTTLLGYGVNYILTLYYSEKLYPCQYGQRKMHLCFLLLYSVCFIGMELSMSWKLVLWIGSMAAVFVLYRELLQFVSDTMMKAIRNKIGAKDY